MKFKQKKDDKALKQLLAECSKTFFLKKEQISDSGISLNRVFARYMFVLIATNSDYYNQCLTGKPIQSIIASYIGRCRSAISIQRRKSENLYKYNLEFRNKVNNSIYGTYFTD